MTLMTRSSLISVHSLRTWLLWMMFGEFWTGDYNLIIIFCLP